MRDSLPLQLLTFSNIIKLIENNHVNAAILFFPYACMITSIFCPNVSFAFLLDLIEISYYFSNKLFCFFDQLKSEGVSERGGKRSKVLTFLETHYAKRTINTLISLGMVLLFCPDDLRMDSIGTHLVENSIGIARSASFDLRRTRILTSFSYIEFRKKLAQIALIFY